MECQKELCAELAPTQERFTDVHYKPSGAATETGWLVNTFYLDSTHAYKALWVDYQCSLAIPEHTPKKQRWKVLQINRPQSCQTILKDHN
jgi:hypothetical protein